MRIGPGPYAGAVRKSAGSRPVCPLRPGCQSARARELGLLRSQRLRLHSAALPEGLEVRLFPLVAQALGVLDRPVLIDAGRKMPGDCACREAPHASDGPPELGVSGLP